MFSFGGYLANIFIFGPKSVNSGIINVHEMIVIVLKINILTANHLALDTIDEEKLWKYILVPWDPAGTFRIPNLTPNPGIFSKVNGTGPLGCGAHTIFSNCRF